MGSTCCRPESWGVRGRLLASSHLSFDSSPDMLCTDVASPGSSSGRDPVWVIPKERLWETLSKGQWIGGLSAGMGAHHSCPFAPVQFMMGLDYNPTQPLQSEALVFTSSEELLLCPKHPHGVQEPRWPDCRAQPQGRKTDFRPSQLVSMSRETPQWVSSQERQSVASPAVQDS